jgi:hypothetical protein
MCIQGLIITPIKSDHRIRCVVFLSVGDLWLYPFHICFRSSAETLRFPVIKSRLPNELGRVELLLYKRIYHLQQYISTFGSMRRHDQQLPADVSTSRYPEYMLATKVLPVFVYEIRIPPSTEPFSICLVLRVCFIFKRVSKIAKSDY